MVYSLKSMKIRKLSSHYIFNGESKLFKFGILEMDKSGVIRNLRDSGGIIVERAGLEFYNGLMLPCLLAGNMTDLIETLRGDDSGRHKSIELTNHLLTFHSELPYPLSHRQTVKLLSILYDYQQLGPEENTTLQLLSYFTSKAVEKLGTSPFGSFEPGKKPGVLILENIDLQGFRLRQRTEIRVIDHRR
jgi:hypothetical protein